MLIICLRTINWFQVLPFDISNSIYQVFLCNINKLRTALWFQITNNNNNDKTNQKILAKEGRLKRYRDKTKQYRQNRMFQNNEKKFYRQFGGEWAKPYQQAVAREAKRFWSKIWERKDHNEKAEWINNMETELQMFEEGPQVNIRPDVLRATLKKLSNWKTHGLDGIHRFWFKNSPPYTRDLLPK